MKQSSQQIEQEWHSEMLCSAVAPAGVLITARSYLIDRIVPDCEIIQLPEKLINGGELKYRMGNAVFASQMRGRRASFLPAKNRKAPSDRIVFDFRHNSPRNWAHLLNNHLPIYFHITEQLDILWDNTLILLPKKTPGYISRALAMFSLQAWYTDDTIHGQGIEKIVTPWTSIRPTRASWATTPAVLNSLKTATASISGQAPKRVLLLRRSSRCLTNSNEIQALVAPLGFEAIYPEDLSPAEQIDLFMNVEAMIAVHGAGMAPLLYRTPGRPRMTLIELFPCGHVTSVYRLMASQAGASWAGVRGKLKPEYIKPAYTLSKPFWQFSLDNFEVDPHSLLLALDMQGIS